MGERVGVFQYFLPDQPFFQRVKDTNVHLGLFTFDRELEISFVRISSNCHNQFLTFELVFIEVLNVRHECLDDLCPLGMSHLLQDIPVDHMFIGH